MELRLIHTTFAKTAAFGRRGVFATHIDAVAIVGGSTEGILRFLRHMISTARGAKRRTYK
jgi:hypothetical protein